MTMSSSDIQVQGSNDWSIVSKLSVVNSGYFNDPYIGHFVSKPSKRSSLINRGYYVRAKAINLVLKNFLSHHRDCQIVSLGAGFDSSYFRLQAEHHGCLTFVEVDFPEVVKNKWEIINNDPVLSKIAHSGIYHLHAADLRDLKSFSELMRNVLKIDFQQPTLFFSECSITYMDEASSSRLIEWCAEMFTNANFCVYEQIEPNDGFGIVMQQHFSKLGIPLLSLPIYHNKDLQRNRFLDRGWQSCEVNDLNEFSENFIEVAEWERIRTLEPFDEYEGFHFKCGHYIILTASKGGCSSLLSPTVKRATEQIFGHEENISWKLTACPIRRYGQAGTAISGKLWITGGFGSRISGGGGHGRLDDLIVVKQKLFAETPSWDIQTVSQSKSLARMFATVNSVSTGQGSTLVIFGGRTHPSNALSDVLLYNVNDDKQDTLAVPVQLEEQNQTAAPAPRWRHAACTVRANDGGDRILVTGGRGIELAYSDCWTLEISGSSGSRQVIWDPFPALPAARHSHSVSYWNGRALIFGGLDQLERCIGDLLESFVSRERQWSAASSWKGPKPLARYSHQAQILQDRLILVGGVGTASCRIGVCIIDLLRWSCVEYSLPNQDPKWPVIMCSPAVYCDLEETGSIRIWCYGGGCNCFSFGTHLNGIGIVIRVNCH